VARNLAGVPIEVCIPLSVGLTFVGLTFVGLTFERLNLERLRLVRPS
jgi:hypothetical protein